MNNSKKKIDVATFLNGEISMPYFDEYYADQARDRQKALTKPQKSLGKLEDIAIWMAGWQRKSFPTVKNAHCLIFAGNHGIAQKGVSAYPSEVTSQMVENFYAGGAAINQLCNLADMALSVIPIDLKNPKANQKNSGFLPEEREWIDKFIAHGYVDSFRAFNKEPDQYTWWSYRFNVRAKNIGWRIDYFFVTEGLMDKVKDSFITPDIMGSDHCPMVI
mgnify:CR=1 FL=1